MSYESLNQFFQIVAAFNQLAGPDLEKRQRMRKYYDQGMTVREMAIEEGVSDQAISKYLQKQGWPRNKGGIAARPSTLPLHNQILEYREQGLSTEEIAKKVNQTSDLVRRVLKSRGLALEVAARVGKRRQRIADLTKEGRTPAEISSITGLALRTVYDDLKKLGLVPNKASEGSTPRRQRILDLHAQGLSSFEIGKRENAHSSLIDQILARRGLTPNVGVNNQETHPEKLHTPESLYETLEALTDAYASDKISHEDYISQARSLQKRHEDIGSL